jgi:hypothetical protein
MELTSVERNCPLCDGTPEYSRYEIDHDTFAVECSRCGRFRITDEALIALRPEQKAALSAFCRRAKNGNSFVTIQSNNIEFLLASLPKYTPPEKLDNLLQLMADLTPRIGENSHFDLDRDYPLLVAEGRDEINFFTDVLLSRGLLDGDLGGLHVTMPSWERLEQIRQSGHSSTRCFVAMWFDESMREIYDNAIEPAISDAGYEALRIDRHEHINRIDDEIIGQIKRSRFMVADFTGQRYGVYFEAGLMLGLGRSVIWMCRKEELSAGGGLHFDVRQFNFIAYATITEARKRLFDRILAIEGEGPKARTGR